MLIRILGFGQVFEPPLSVAQVKPGDIAVGIYCYSAPIVIPGLSLASLISEHGPQVVQCEFCLLELQQCLVDLFRLGIFELGSVGSAQIYLCVFPVRSALDVLFI